MAWSSAVLGLPEWQVLRARYHRHAGSADKALAYATEAAVIACAERYGGRVLTLDPRHFGVVAREGKLTLLPWNGQIRGHAPPRRP